MRFHSIPVPLPQLIATMLLTPTPLVQASPAPALSNLAGFSWHQLFARYECGGEVCGWQSQLCCSAGSACFTDANNQAQCTYAATSTVAGGDSGGYWTTYTSVFTETDTHVTTSIVSSYIDGVAPATATATCNLALNESPCGNICCASNQYCYVAGQCSAAVNTGSSAYHSPSATSGATVIAGPGIRPTSQTTSLVTETRRPTATVPFETPIATGANVTLTSARADNGGGLSGGAIAGIVIGVLLGLFLLGLLCFYCCLRGLLGSLFGGKKRKRTTEIEEYEHRSHHRSGAGGGRTWYGARKPARSRHDDRDRQHSRGKEMLGLAAGLATLWAVLGLKRRNRKRNEEKPSEYSYSSDYYTSASSASSDDRRTRDTRQSVARR